MPYSIIQLESDLDLITLAQKLIHKRFFKMDGNGFDMERGSRPLIWYPMTHWAPPLLGPGTPKMPYSIIQLEKLTYKLQNFHFPPLLENFSI